MLKGTHLNKHRHPAWQPQPLTTISPSVKNNKARQRDLKTLGIGITPAGQWGHLELGRVRTFGTFSQERS